ncbi:MAG TPA: PEGA domain-containing protein [Gammaproteobacteria bacterium]|nr:PEGA domain-containing protein [Gammaproteobacteria bacterium]
MSAGSQARDSVVTIEYLGRTRELPASALPITIGADAGATLRIDGLPGVIEIDERDGGFFVAGRGARNLRVEGASVAGTRELKDGEVIAFDRARLQCSIAAGRLAIAIETLVTAGDTAPPDLAAVAIGGDADGDAHQAIVKPVAFKLPPVVGAGEKQGHSKAMTIAVGAVLALLAGFAWFAFTAKEVALNIDPEPDALNLPSTLFKIRYGDHYLLRPGQHRVAATLKGYYPLDTQFEVSSASGQVVDLKLKKLPGLVTLTTEPEATAHVLLDGMPLGETPLKDTEIAPGVHRLELSADRFLPQVVEIDVRGAAERQSLIAKLTPNWAPVSVATQPPGATVLVDGVNVGVTPLEAQVTAGERQIEARLSGYNAWTNKVIVSAGTPLQLPEVKLALADGRVDIVSNPPEANVSIDGEFRGRSPLTVKLAPGKAHELTLTKPGYETATQSLSIAADSGRKLTIDLVAQYGEVQVESTPVGADVWVDGERRAATPVTLSLTGVSHEVEIRRTGFANAQQRVTPRPGFPQKLAFDLTALDQSTGGGYPTVRKTGLGQELRLIPSGQFTMGSSRREQGRRANEVLRPVRLTKAFYLGVREVTNAEFRAFKPDHKSGEFGGKTLDEGDQPVVRVTPEDAMQYLNWLSIRDGLQPVYEQKNGIWAPVRPLRGGYRLPTEAEWEWAARHAGRDAPLLYPWGTDWPPPDRSGNWADVSARNMLPLTMVTYNDGFPVSAPAGTFEPNPVGIRDLSSNVAEWTQDFYVPDITENVKLVEDPLGPETGQLHVVRGASWRSSTVAELRMAARNSGADAREDIGFRIARNLE